MSNNFLDLAQQRGALQRVNNLGLHLRNNGIDFVAVDFFSTFFPLYQTICGPHILQAYCEAYKRSGDIPKHVYETQADRFMPEVLSRISKLQAPLSSSTPNAHPPTSPLTPPPPSLPPPPPPLPVAEVVDSGGKKKRLPRSAIRKQAPVPPQPPPPTAPPKQSSPPKQPSPSKQPSPPKPRVKVCLVIRGSSSEECENDDIDVIARCYEARAQGLKIFASVGAGLEQKSLAYKNARFKALGKNAVLWNGDLWGSIYQALITNRVPVYEFPKSAAKTVPFLTMYLADHESTLMTVAIAGIYKTKGAILGSDSTLYTAPYAPDAMRIVSIDWDYDNAIPPFDSTSATGDSTYAATVTSSQILLKKLRLCLNMDRCAALKPKALKSVYERLLLLVLGGLLGNSFAESLPDTSPGVVLAVVRKMKYSIWMSDPMSVICWMLTALGVEDEDEREEYVNYPKFVGQPIKFMRKDDLKHFQDWWKTNDGLLSKMFGDRGSVFNPAFFSPPTFEYTEGSSGEENDEDEESHGHMDGGGGGGAGANLKNNKDYIKMSKNAKKKFRQKMYKKRLDHEYKLDPEDLEEYVDQKMFEVRFPDMRKVPEKNADGTMTRMDLDIALCFFQEMGIDLPTLTPQGAVIVKLIDKTREMVEKMKMSKDKSGKW